MKSLLPSPMIFAATLALGLAAASASHAGSAAAENEDAGPETAAAEAEAGAASEDAAGETEIAAAEGDAAAGEEIYMKDCRACHGPTGKGVSSYPKLAGQPAEHLVEMLERYRSGEKIGPNTMLMAPRAKKLSDEDIADVVAFITSLE